jgi:ATP-dependent Clp protease adaptor protein ClpS
VTTSTIAPTRPDIDIQVAPDEDVEAQLDPPYRVLIHNDDVTTMEFVVYILITIFELPLETAEMVMLTAHVTGVAYVGTYPLEDAKYRVGKAHSLARVEGYPLTFTIEPEE